MDNFALDFSLPQIAQGSRVAYTTLIDLLPKLIKQEIIIETRKIGESNLFKINMDSPVVRALFAIDLKLSEVAIQKKVVARFYIFLNKISPFLILVIFNSLGISLKLILKLKIFAIFSLVSGIKG